MTNSPGYIYILTNPSMPNLIKVGKSIRPPVERVKELSAATGVPTPFILRGYVYVQDVDLVERLSHITLSERGFRPAANREFFSCSPDEAFSTIKAIQLQTENSANSLKIAEGLYSLAMSTWARETSIVARTQVFKDLERAADLGHLLASHQAGLCALEISDRKRNERDAEFFKLRGVTLLHNSASQGVLNSYLQLHQYYIRQDDQELAVNAWHSYIIAMENEAFPPQELALLVDYLIEVVFQSNSDMTHLTMLKHPILIQHAFAIYRKMPSSKYTQQQRMAVLQFLNPKLAFIIKSAMWPSIILTTFLVGLSLRPDLVVVVGFLFFIVVGVISTYTKRTASRRKKKASKRKRE